MTIPNLPTKLPTTGTHLAGSTGDYRKRISGFTLVELLVVIAIIGVLVALLLPAIQAAREAARRNQCLSQIKQLALGCLNTHDTQKHFPTGGWGYGWVGDPDRGFGKNQPGGWIYNVLPFIEQQALHDLGSDGNPDTLTPQQLKGAADVLEQPINIINCPSRRPNTPWPMELNNAVDSLKNAEYRAPSAVAGRSDYAMSSGTRMTEIDSGPPSFADAATWRWAVETTSRPEYLDGISFQISRVTIQQITDGTSQTLMIGEKFIPPSKYGSGKFRSENETWCTGWNNDNFRIIYGVQTAIGSTVYNIRPPMRDVDFARDDENVTDPEQDTLQTWNRFGSAHPSVWVAAYCDGSTHSLGYDADPEMLRRLASRHDGLTLDTSGL
jgi:prepilin-type N-terminal cleavage/methylation domain-containing protein